MIIEMRNANEPSSKGNNKICKQQIPRIVFDNLFNSCLSGKIENRFRGLENTCQTDTGDSKWFQLHLILPQHIFHRCEEVFSVMKKP